MSLAQLNGSALARKTMRNPLKIESIILDSELFQALVARRRYSESLALSRAKLCVFARLVRGKAWFFCNVVRGLAERPHSLCPRQGVAMLSPRLEQDAPSRCQI